MLSKSRDQKGCNKYRKQSFRKLPINMRNMRLQEKERRKLIDDLIISTNTISEQLADGVVPEKEFTLTKEDFKKILEHVMTQIQYYKIRNPDYTPGAFLKFLMLRVEQIKTTTQGKRFWTWYFEQQTEPEFKRFLDHLDVQRQIGDALKSSSTDINQYDQKNN